MLHCKAEIIDVTSGTNNWNFGSHFATRATLLRVSCFVVTGSRLALPQVSSLINFVKQLFFVFNGRELLSFHVILSHFGIISSVVLPWY